jgi:HK97 family phage prohead protease
MSRGTQKQFSPQVRSFDLSRSSINEDERTVDVVFSTETDQVERSWGVEILDHGSKSVRLKRLNNSAPLLLDHDPREQVGVIESARIDGRAGAATVRFSRSAKGEEIFQDVKDGIRSKISVGYRVHALVMEKRDKQSGKETYRVMDWEPFEISLVSIPADDGAGVRDAASIFGQRAAELSTSITMENQDQDQQRADTATAPAATAPAEAQNEVRAAAEVERELNKLQIAQLAKEEAARAIAEDRKRAAEITECGNGFRRNQAEITKAIESGLSIDDYKRQLLDSMKTENPAYSAGRVEVVSEPVKKGTRQYLQSTWAENAKRALGDRGRNIVVPTYSEAREFSRNYIGGSQTPFHRSLTGSVTLVDKLAIDEGIGMPIVEEVVAMYPEIAVFPVDTISGDTVTLSIQTGNPSVGYRNANEGTSAKKGTFASRIFQTSIIEQFINVDIQGVLNASKDPARVLTAEARSVTKAVLSHIAFQQWYAGTVQANVDSKAAPGFLAQSNSASTHVVDATGSTAKSSVWIMELLQGECDHVYGNDNTLLFGEDWTEETVDDANGNSLRCLQNWISGRVAPRLANKNRAIRIKNIGTDSGKGLTDALLAKAFRQARELGMNPNAIFATPRSIEQLQVSRTTYSPIGAPAPMPEEYQGVPIYQTINLSNAETV